MDENSISNNDWINFKLVANRWSLDVNVLVLQEANERSSSLEITSRSMKLYDADWNLNIAVKPCWWLSASMKNRSQMPSNYHQSLNNWYFYILIYMYSLSYLLCITSRISSLSRNLLWYHHLLYDKQWIIFCFCKKL